jgi:hypothetical protein
MIFLLANTIITSIDHQDGWILSGIEIPFIIFNVLYIVFFYNEEKVNALVLFSILSKLTFVLVPNLKYNFFIGRSVDQHMQYHLADYIMLNGFIADKTFTSYSLTTQYYTGVPLLHLSISIYSILLGMPLVQAFKFLPTLWNVSYPLITYYIIKNTKVAENNPKLLKYSLYLSSIPISGTISYIVTGTTLAYLFAHYILSQVVILKDPENRNYQNIFLYLIFTTTSIFTHSLLMLYFFVLIFIIILIYSRLRGIEINRLLVNLFAFNIFTDITWISYQVAPLNILTSFLRIGWVSEAITPTFYAIRNLTSALMVVLSFYASDILISVFLFLSLVTLAYQFIVKREFENTQLFFSIFTILIWFLTFIGFVFGISNKFWERTFRWAIIAYPFIYAIFFVKPSLSIRNSGIFQSRQLMLIIFSLLSISSIIHFYNHPYFVPPASSVFPDIAPETPLVYRGRVNSIYQRHMVQTAEKYLRGSIACDAVTRNQIRGLTDRDFSYSYLLRYFPPDLLIFPDLEEKEYSYLLTHLPGVSGTFEERALVRSEEVILDLIYDETHNNIYTNSQSFMLAKW